MNAIAEIARFLSYPFAVRAIVVGGAVSLCAALLGVTLVLKRYSMIGDGLSHVGFAIFAVSAALGTTGAELYMIILFVVFFPKIFAVTFDEDFARGIGVHAGAYNMLIASLTAVTVVVGMRMMGTLLITALIIFPSLTAMRVFRSFRGVAVCSAVVSLVCFFVGVAAAHLLAIPAGSTVVVVNAAAFAIASVIGTLRGKMGRI